PAEGVAGQLRVVGGRVVAAQAQPETAPTAGDAVTGAGVAAADAQGGDELLPEADRPRFVAVGDDDRDVGRARPGPDGQHRPAVLVGLQEAAGAEGDDAGGLSA